MKQYNVIPVKVWRGYQNYPFS